MDRRIGIAFILVSLAGVAQLRPDALKSHSLTDEELKVYQTAIDDYRSRAPRQPVFVVDHTSTLAPAEDDYQSCMKGFPKPPPKQLARKLDMRFQKACKVKLVAAPIRSEDSTQSDGGQPACYFMFSEIMFDRKHLRAAFWVGTNCSGVRGGTTVYERHRGVWGQSNEFCPMGLAD